MTELALAPTQWVPARFSRQKYFSLAVQDTVESFLSMFHRYGYIFRPFAGGSWISANEKWKLGDSEILKAIAGVHSRYFIGTRAGKASRYAVIDVDHGSRYHNQKGVDQICSVLTDAGITETHLYQSSESGGWHLYMFFDEPISSRDLRNQLVQLFQLHDFEVSKGTLEIFPHPGENSLGQGLRLPLQFGFAWLNHSNLVVHEDRLYMSPQEALLTFMRDVECSNTRHQFHQLKAFVAKVASTREALVNRVREPRKKSGVISIRNHVYETSSQGAKDSVIAAFGKIPPRMDPDVWFRGRNYFQAGLTGPSQRADATFCLSHYLFYGDPDHLQPPLGYGYEDERRWVIEEILRLKHNGNSNDITAGRAEVRKHIGRATNWVPPARREEAATKYESAVPVSWVLANQNKAKKARQKIAEVVKEFKEVGAPFSMRELRLAAHCSSDTLYKNEDLWRATQTDLSNRCLTNDPGVFNAVVGAASSESKPPSTTTVFEMPPGRLAARRIVFELMRRDRKTAKKRENELKDHLQGFKDLWQKQVVENMPERVSEIGTKKLQSLAVIYGALVQQSPSEEDQLLVQNILLDIRNELQVRHGPPKEVPFQTIIDFADPALFQERDVG